MSLEWHGIRTNRKEKRTINFHTCSERRIERESARRNAELKAEHEHKEKKRQEDRDLPKELGHPTNE